MTDRHLTISDAEKFTGKSRSTLRRFIDAIVKADNSPDRHLLLPTIEEVAVLRQDNQPFAWRVSEDLLRRHFLKPEEPAANESKQGSGATGDAASSPMITVLEKSLAILERELAEKNSQIAAMNERLRESNILMKDLQQRLALPASSSGNTAVPFRNPITFTWRQLAREMQTAYSGATITSRLKDALHSTLGAMIKSSYALKEGESRTSLPSRERG